MARDHVAILIVAGTVAALTACDSSSPVQPSSSPARPLIPGFFLSGRVVDTAYRPIAAARVEIVNGPRAGTVEKTDTAGRFAIDGMLTDITNVIASKEGYISETRTFPPPFVPLEGLIEGSRLEAQFYLAPSGSSADIAGVYSLTMTADSSCTNLPAVARARTYTATITPSGRPGFFMAQLSDATFFSEPCPPGRPPESCSFNHVAIGLAGDYASVGMGTIEQLIENGFLRFEGEAEGPFGPGGIKERFTGSIVYCPVEMTLVDLGTYACPAAGGMRCESNAHQLVLTRR